MSSVIHCVYFTLYAILYERNKNAGTNTNATTHNRTDPLINDTDQPQMSSIIQLGVPPVTNSAVFLSIVQRGGGVISMFKNFGANFV